jgi:hypothetical protein
VISKNVTQIKQQQQQQQQRQRKATYKRESLQAIDNRAVDERKVVALNVEKRNAILQVERRYAARECNNRMELAKNNRR